MRGSLVVTIVGPDRTGLVETLAHEISAAGGNWEASRMVRLAGQFAGVLLVTTPPDGQDALHRALAALSSAGLTVTTHAAGEAPPPATRVAHLDITGADRVGLVRDVARVLAARGVNVEEFESDVHSAPMSGAPLFLGRALLRVTAEQSLPALRADLEALGSDLMIDLLASDD